MDARRRHSSGVLLPSMKIVSAGWKKRWGKGAAIASLALLALIAWVWWAPWPDPLETPLEAAPDALVLLGGGDAARGRKGVELALAYPQAQLVVTGDGGLLVQYLKEHGIPEHRISAEDLASSTVENARNTVAMLDAVHGQRVVLITNWFHVPRSLAIFRSLQPQRTWTAAFEPKPNPLTQWDRACARRERLAGLYLLVRHGIWCF